MLLGAYFTLGRVGQPMQVPTIRGGVGGTETYPCNFNHRLQHHYGRSFHMALYVASPRLPALADRYLHL